MAVTTQSRGKEEKTRRSQNRSAATCLCCPEGTRAWERRKWFFWWLSHTKVMMITKNQLKCQSGQIWGWWSCTHICEWNELKIIMPQLFEYMKMPKKFHAIWTGQNSTCFMKHLPGQKFGKIAQGKWSNGISQNLVERELIWMGKCPGKFSA